MTRIVLLAWLAGCAEGVGEADDLCVAERLPDTLDGEAWTIGVQIPLATGGTVHAEARWPRAGTGPWPVALVLHGAWDPEGTPIAGGTMRADPTAGIVDVHLDLPGNGRTEGVNDRRGEASRAAVATVLRWAAGLDRDTGGCTLGDRVPNAASDDLYVIGSSNGGNLAVATLADNADELPDVSGLVLWETPAGPQFVNVELGASPSVYVPGTCALDDLGAITCDIPVESLEAGEREGDPVLCFDLDGDGACGRADVIVPGVLDFASGLRFVSPTLASAAAARGLAGSTWADADTAADWWADRDAARLAPALVDRWPALPILLLASEEDHVQTLSDHPHVYGLGEALQRAGAAWTRLNPGTRWLPRTTAENAPDLPLTLAEPRGTLLTEREEDPTTAMLSAAVAELSARKASGDW